MKSFTDLPQSKKLAEFLPLGSADMFWLVLGNTPRIHVLTEPISNYSHWEYYPAWSLAALFSVLPKSARLEKGKATELYSVSLPVELKASDWHINPVDACVDMVIKLHEQKLL